MQRMSKFKTVNIRIFYGGEFSVLDNGYVVYGKGKIELLPRVSLEKINYTFLFHASQNLMPPNKTAVLWYVLPGHSIRTGRDFMRSEDDIPIILESIDKYGMLDLYLVEGVMNQLVNSSGSPRTKRPLCPLQPNYKAFASPQKTTIPTLLEPKKESMSKIPLRNSPRQIVESSSTIPTNHQNSPLSTKQPISMVPLRRSPRHLTHTNLETDGIEWSTINPLISSHQPQNQPINYKTPLNRSKLAIKKKEVVVPLTVSGKRTDDTPVSVKDCLSVAVGSYGKQVVEEKIHKGKQIVEEAVKKGGKQFIRGKKVVGEERVTRGKKDKEIIVSEGVKSKKKNKGKGVKKAVRKAKKKKIDLFSGLDEEYIFEGDCDTDSNCSEVDIDFEVGEEDGDKEDLLEGSDGGDLLGRVNSSLINQQKFNLNESDHESDELISLEGSDEEGDNAPVFDKSTDFRRNINLVVGLKFADNDVLRQALRHHSVENTYDYYYLQSDNRRVTTYCRYKCQCEWSIKKARIVGCDCKKKKRDLICKFRVHASKLKREATFQIKSLYLKHTCSFEMKSKKVTSEYLATRFLEDWRENPYWKVKVFQAHVKRKIGIDVPYARCWVARARAKLMIYGDGADQYMRVWDYAAILRKYNPGSSVFVKVEGIERPPPLFQRMYVCMKACKDGFLAGCRPLIGVDGCHLKGAYPGMCLVAVGKDGNNNIYPIAWAVVEVENRETWSWFLRLLVEDLGKDEGDGLTFMSDRQKGLLDAFSIVTPKADLRFCVRHIWANFKLQFAGQAYKDLFWSASRTTSKVQFDDTMAAMKSLNPDAYAYLAAIPPKHWSRHAFSPTCKSNMLLNNICETFNSVLKEARDKPILTFMEWIRRYVMTKRVEKRNSVSGLDGSLMPYVSKYLNWAQEESRLCSLINGSNEEYEVDHRGDTYVVDLATRKCGCIHWELTGIPCAHAVACIVSRRKDPKTYVHEAYSKRRYMMAYEPSIAAMPGIKQWPKVDQPQPLPPAFRKLPGRPNMKKRRKEADEGTSKQVKRARKSRACSRCGDLGHNNRTCNKDVVVKETAPAINKVFRRKGTSEWAVKEREKREKRKADKVAYTAAGHSVPANKTTMTMNVLIHRSR